MTQRSLVSARELAPTDIPSGLKFSFDADTTVNAGGLITQWTDLSGNGNHATASGTARPSLITNNLNGHSIVRHDGVANGFDVSGAALALTGAFTWIGVFKTTGPSSDGVLFANGINNGNNLGITHHNAASPWFYVSNANNVNGSLGSGVWTIGRYSWTGTADIDAMLVRLSGAINARKTSTYSGTLANANYTIGKPPAVGGGFYIGDMAAQSLWSTVLPEGQAVAVERYYARRFALSTF